MKVAYLSNCLADLRLRRHLLSDIAEHGHTIVACVTAPSLGIPIAELKDIGELELVPLSYRSTNLLGDLRYALRARAFLQKQKPDIVLNRALKPAIYGSLAARMVGIRRTFSLICGLGFAFGDETLRQKTLAIFVSMLCRISLSRNIRVFFQNPDDRDLFCGRHLIRPQQAVLVPGSGVDLDDFQLSAPVTEGPVFLLASRLLRSKGVNEFLKAAGAVKRKHPSAKFMLVGPQADGADCLDRHSLTECVESGLAEVHGEVPDIRPFMSRASVFVLPSYYREGVPRAALEAMAMGRPVITADTPGCRETVIDGENGFLVPAKNTRRLEQAMERFIADPALIATMGKRSREIAAAKFKMDDVNRIILTQMGLCNAPDLS